MRVRPRWPTQSIAARASPSAAVTLDIPSETNEIIEFQLFGQHPVELVIAKSPVGHNQDFDVGRKGFGKPNQHLIFVAVPGYPSRCPCRRSAIPAVLRAHDW
jgi:hypothetical protein